MGRWFGCCLKKTNFHAIYGPSHLVLYVQGLTTNIKRALRAVGVFYFPACNLNLAGDPKKSFGSRSKHQTPCNGHANLVRTRLQQILWSRVTIRPPSWLRYSSAWWGGTLLSTCEMFGDRRLAWGCTCGSQNIFDDRHLTFWHETWWSLCVQVAWTWANQWRIIT